MPSLNIHHTYNCLYKEIPIDQGLSDTIIDLQ